MRAAASSFPVPHMRQDLTCQSKASQDRGGVRLVEPVRLEGSSSGALYSRESMRDAMRSGFEDEAAIGADDIVPATDVAPLLPRHLGQSAASNPTPYPLPLPLPLTPTPTPNPYPYPYPYPCVACLGLLDR